MTLPSELVVRLAAGGPPRHADGELSEIITALAQHYLEALADKAISDIATMHALENRAHYSVN